MEGDNPERDEVFEQNREVMRYLVKLCSPKNPLNCMVLSTSLIDTNLTALFMRLLLKGRNGSTRNHLLDHNGGSLGSTMAKGDLAYCLGVISKTCYQNIQAIARARNLSAHRIEHSVFDSEKVIAECKKLILPQGKLRSFMQYLWNDGEVSPEENLPDRFHVVSLLVYMDIGVQASKLVVKTEIKQEDDWWKN